MNGSSRHAVGAPSTPVRRPSSAVVLGSALALLVGLAAAGCDRDPARSVKVIERPSTRPAALAEPTPASDAGANATAATGALPLAPAVAPVTAAAAVIAAPAFRLDACPPLPEDDAGPSTMALDGPCAFRHRAAASCESLGDDFIMVATRPAKDGATAMIYVNVEKYTGPGKYSEAQMFVGVQDKVNIWRWSSDNVNITVGKDEAFAEMPRTRLLAEPVLVNCTGPMTNYQCDGRGEVPAFERSLEVVSGRLQCETVHKEEASTR